MIRLEIHREFPVPIPTFDTSPWDTSPVERHAPFTAGTGNLNLDLFSGLFDEFGGGELPGGELCGRLIRPFGHQARDENVKKLGRGRPPGRLDLDSPPRAVDEACPFAAFHGEILVSSRIVRAAPVIETVAAARCHP